MAFALSLTILLFAGFCAADYGTPAVIEDFPSLVQIELGVSFIWSQTCVGSVLTSRHILSAARCFAGPLAIPRFRRVRAGTTYRGVDGVTVGVEAVSNHPAFATNQLEGDITVVRLEASLTFDATIQQGAIIGQDVAIPASLPVVQAGWGNTAEGSIFASRELHSIDFVTANHDACVARYASLLIPIFVSSDMICTRLPTEEGARYGLRDVGSPIYYNNVIIGVVSFGKTIGKSFPIVATNVASYSNWIVDSAV